jgi:2-phosphoglycerate kinase
MTNKKILLIGGCPGSGKTTLAGKLSFEQKFDHRLGTGYVREIVKSTTDQMTNPELFRFTFDGGCPINNLECQCQTLKKHIFACVQRSLNEGTSLIIEGSHLIPSIYFDLDRKLGFENYQYIVLKSPEDELEHQKRLLGDTHLYRQINPTQFLAIRKIHKYYLDQANLHDCRVVEN